MIRFLSERYLNIMDWKELEETILSLRRLAPVELRGGDASLFAAERPGGFELDVASFMAAAGDEVVGLDFRYRAGVAGGCHGPFDPGEFVCVEVYERAGRLDSASAASMIKSVFIAVGREFAVPGEYRRGEHDDCHGYEEYGESADFGDVQV